MEWFFRPFNRNRFLVLWVSARPYSSSLDEPELGYCYSKSLISRIYQQSKFSVADFSVQSDYATVSSSPKCSKKQSADVLVLGAGVVGLSLAWELSKRGQNVIIVEAGQIGRGRGGASSWAGAGILPPAPTKNAIDPLDKLKALSHQVQADWARELVESTGIETGYRRCGGIYMALTQGELATLVAGEAWWDEHGIQHQRLSVDELVELEPALFHGERNDIKGGWLLPDECQIRNPHLLQALHAACVAAGVQVLEDCEVVNLERNPEGRVTAILTTDGERHWADQVCICSGAWSIELLKQFQTPNGLMPVRGQMLLYEFSDPPLSHVINEGNRYLVPRDSGQLLCGSIEEEVGFEVKTTGAALDEIRQWAESVLPMLQEKSVAKSWAGLRPGSYDGIPYLGSIPGYENLFVATGHFRSGIHLSCGTAICMADLITGQESRLDLTPFRVGRG